MSHKFCARFLSFVLLIASTFLDATYARSATPSESSETNNAVAEYLYGATENTRGEDHRQVLEQALNDMLDLPVKQLREKHYPDYEMHPDAWSVTVVLERYIAPKRHQDLTISDKFFDEIKAESPTGDPCMVGETEQ